MGRIFVWERSMRAQAVVYQPALYYDNLPRNLKGESMPEGTFILVHQEREDEKNWGLFRFAETYPCPAVRQVQIGKNYASAPVQTRQDIDAAQARERVARHLAGSPHSGGNGGSSATHDNQEDERSTQDQRGYDTERIGGNGVETQGSEVHSTGEGQTQDGMASDNGDI